MRKIAQKRLFNGVNRQITKLTRNLDDLKNKSLYPYEDAADYIKVGPIKAVRLG